MSIKGNTVGTPIPRPDFNQTDSKKADYIKNKPVENPRAADEGKFLRAKNGKWEPDGNVATLGADGKIPLEQLPVDSELRDDSENPVMNHVVKAAFVALGRATKIVSGSYVGVGTSYQNPETTPTVLTFPSEPKVLFIVGRYVANSYSVTDESFAIITPSYGQAFYISDSKVVAKSMNSVTLSGNADSGYTMSWYHYLSDVQMTRTGHDYEYIALCEEVFTAWDGGDY